MEKIARPTLSCLALVALAGCGDLLTDGTYEGEPRLVISGSILSLDTPSHPGDAYLVVVWSWDNGRDMSTGQIASVTAQTFPAQVTFAVHDEPEDFEFFYPGYLAFAVVAVIIDADGDGSISPAEVESESLVGASNTHMILFARDLNDATRARSQKILNPEDLQPGYNLAEFVCAPRGGTFDRLRVIPNEEITIKSLTEYNNGCTNWS